MSSSVRGVIHSGVFTDAENFSLVVSHPHPDGNFGGGPGPVNDWRKPYDLSAYSFLVDDDAGDPDDARFELREYRHVAVCRAGRWSLHELPANGTIEVLEAVSAEAFRVLVSYGGSAFYAATFDGAGWHTFTYAGLPPLPVAMRACFIGDELVLACSESFEATEPSAVAIAARQGDTFAWARPLPSAPGRVLELASARGGQRLVAGGQGLWRFEDGKWSDAAYPGGRVTVLSCAADGEILAGTDRGEVLGGDGCRLLGRVGPVHSVVRFGAFIYAADDEQVYRFGPDGFEKCFQPPIASAGGWPRAGRLAVGGGRLWLAGSHDLASTHDGLDWTIHPISSGG